MVTYIIYTYFETSQSLVNLKYFIDNGFIQDAKYKYILVVNGGICTVDIPSDFIVLKRENNGLDFGGWYDAFKHLNFPETMEDDDHVIMMNDSIQGPFIKEGEIWID